MCASGLRKEGHREDGSGRHPRGREKVLGVHLLLA